MKKKLNWTHHAEEVDGRWSKSFRTFEQAIISLKKYVKISDETEVHSSEIYFSDIGGRHHISRHDGLTDKQREKYREAYDARECGTATKAQMFFLETVESR